MKLQVKNICKTFENNQKQKTVLENISFEVNQGKFVTLLGPSGCGKTTMLSIIAGFEKADEGTTELDGAVIEGSGSDRGYVFQNYALFPWMTVKENILFPMKQTGMSGQEQVERLEYLLQISKLQGQEELYPHQISGGMKQRTALVRALANKPKILLMDEPMGALDMVMRQSLQRELDMIRGQEHTTSIMVTHDVDEAIYLSDEVILMSTDRGKILCRLEIDLPRPRNRNCPKYKEYYTQLMEEMIPTDEVERIINGLQDSIEY